MLTSAEASERLGLSQEQVRRLVRSGEIEAVKTGGAPNSHFRITEEAIADYLERHKVVPVRAAS